MPDKSNKLIWFFKEFKRRKVGQVLIAYSGISAVIIGIIPIIEEELNLPPITSTLILILLIIGLPIAGILTWGYQMKSKEDNKTEPEKEDNKKDNSLSEAQIPPEKSIVVLPFENISPDPDQEYFSDGLTEEIIADISQIHDLLVISRSSAMTFKGTKKMVKEIAKEVNVQYILEGSVRKAGNDLRITAQLINASTDAHIWAEKYSGTLDAVFDIQEKVSLSITEALKLKLNPVEKLKIIERPINNFQAYDCYQKAMHDLSLWNEESIDRAIINLNKGLELVGDNNLLYTALGQAYHQYHEMGVRNPQETFNKVEEYANKILLNEPKSSSANLLLGLLERSKGSHMEACKLLTISMQSDPYNPTTLLWLCWVNTLFMGRPIIGGELFNKLKEIDPLSATTLIVSGGYYWINGDFDRASREIQKLLELGPNIFRWCLVWLANLYLMNDQQEKAEKVIDKAIKDIPDDMVSKLLIFLKHVLSGNNENAIKYLTIELKEYAWQDPEIPWFMAQYFSICNEVNLSLDWLERAVERGWINYPLFSEMDPLLENIRNEERFKKLMVKVKHLWEKFDV
ncbi:hypothetical protein ACFLSI_00210 [Bacteroidota bacterium]